MDLGVPVEKWTYPVLESGWRNVGRSHMPARFRRLANGLVVVNGELKDGDCGSLVLSFPADYAPVALTRLPVVGADYVLIGRGGEMFVSGDCDEQISINVIFQSGAFY